MKNIISMTLITVTYNRPKQLKDILLPTIINQQDKNFEWIIVNDGGNQETKNIIENLDVDFPITYIEMDHLEQGFSLCAGKNLAINNAKSDIIGYIDDDNKLYSNYTYEIVKAFEEKECSYLMAQQNRWQYMTKDDVVIQKNGPQLSPMSACILKDLVKPNKSSYFDSNGFAHLRTNSPKWDPEYRVFCDYTYLFNSIRNWGTNNFYFLEIPLVDYIQTSDGVIGTSNYSEWAKEFNMIWNDPHYQEICLMFEGEKWFPGFINYFEKKSTMTKTIDHLDTT